MWLVYCEWELLTEWKISIKCVCMCLLLTDVPKHIYYIREREREEPVFEPLVNELFGFIIVEV